MNLGFLNSKIEAIKRAACGYRNKSRFIVAILFHCGKLDLMPKLNAYPPKYVDAPKEESKRIPAYSQFIKSFNGKIPGPKLIAEVQEALVDFASMFI